MLVPERSERAIAQLSLALGDGTVERCANPALEALRASQPGGARAAAAGDAWRSGAPEPIVLDYLAPPRLLVHVECPA